jgi:hypothetical protein
LSGHSLDNSQFQPLHRDAARFRSDEKAGQLYGLGGNVKDTSGRGFRSLSKAFDKERYAKVEVMCSSPVSEAG